MFSNIAAFQIENGQVLLVKAKKLFSSIEFICFDSISFQKEDESSLVRAITEIAIRNDLSSSKIIASISSNNLILKTFSFPFSNRKQLEQVIPIEAEENIPISLDLLTYSFQILQKKKFETDVLFAASEKEVTKNICEIFEKCNLNLHSLYLENNAIFSLFKFSTYATNGLFYQIDISHDRTIINVIENGSLIFSRILQSGYKDLIKAFASKIKKIKQIEIEDICERIDFNEVSKTEINKIAKKYKLSDKDIKKIIEDFLASCTKLSKNIFTAIKQFERLSETNEVEKIFLSGSSSIVQSIANTLFKTLNTPIYELSAVSILKNAQITPNFNIPSGLIISEVVIQNQINLCVENSNTDNLLFKNFKLPAFFTICGLAFFILYFIIIAIVLSIRNGANNEVIANQYKRLFRQESPSTDFITEAKKLRDSERRKLNKFNAIIPDKSDYLLNLETILKNFSSDPSFVLRDLTMNDKTIQFIGETADVAKIEDLKNKLQQTKNYASVDLSTSFSGKTSSKFTLIIKYKTSGGKGK